MAKLHRHPPDFAIIGAPKCGTTSLANWLGEHPAIYMSPIKEPEYFATDAPWPRLTSTEAGYRRLFKGAKANQLCGEATCRYLFSDVAVPEMLAVNPAIKLIVMLRSPLDMAPSLHAQRLFNRRERRTEFEEAWRRSPSRDPWRDYRSLCALGAQLERLLTRVDRRQVHVIVFDDLKKPAAVYRDTLRFLGVQPDDRAEFPVANTRKTHRWDFPDRLLRNPPFPLASIKRLALRHVPRWAKTVRRQIDAMNSRPVERTQLRPELHAEMAEYFLGDVRLLGRLLNRDLSHWLA